jgi:peptidoglycan/xylan/chitin deacetylase (PgdA/CDA1 family)
MQNKCTVVTYHYVRETNETRFPKINGLNLSLFREQIAYMRNFYEFITVQDCIDAIYDGGKLPNNAALLTFDDGYIDHYTNVFPILEAAGIQGCFFPPVSAVRDGKVLDVNKIHFILASVDSVNRLKLDVFDLLNRLRSEGHEILPNKELYEKLAKSEFFDTPEVIFVKRLLQRELPQALRTYILDELFKRYVTVNELAFARELYLNKDQLRMMARHGMIIGSHGNKHLWMNTLSELEQRNEIECSIDFLHSIIGAPIDNWIMCYPYGAHNKSLRNICSEMSCSMAFTTESGIATLNEENALILPRLDTNIILNDHKSNTFT